MLLRPIRAMFQKKSRQFGISSKDRKIESGCVPVAAAHANRPAKRDHEPRTLVAAFPDHVRQRSQLRVRERARQIGSSGADAPRLRLIAAGARRNESLFLRDGLRSTF